MERPYVSPLTRSLAAPIGRLLPSRSHGLEANEVLLAAADGRAQDNGNPYAFGGYGAEFAPDQHGYDFGAPPAVHHAQAFGAPLAPRQSIGTAYVTPPQLWNLSGVATGWSQAFAPTPGRPPIAKLAFGQLGALLAGANPTVRAPLPTLPEPQRMVAPGF